MKMKTVFGAAGATVLALSLAACAPAASEDTAPAPKATETSAPTPEPVETVAAAPEYPEVDLPACWDLPVPGYPIHSASEPTETETADTGVMCSIGSYAGGDTAAMHAWADEMVASGWTDVDPGVEDAADARSVVAPDQSHYVLVLEFADGTIVFFKEKNMLQSWTG